MPDREAENGMLMRDLSPEEEGAQNPLMVVHRLLRGRYRWAVALGVAGVILGGIAGWLAAQPNYKSTGIVRIRPVLPKVIYSTEQNSMMPMFQGFMESQVAILGSRRVIDLAMNHDNWQPYATQSSDHQIGEFEEKLQVNNPRPEIITISFTDPNREKAQAAVASIVQSYERIYDEINSQGEGLRQQVLNRRLTALTNQIESQKDQIAAIAGQFGAEGLQQMHELKVQELGNLEQKLNSLEIARAVAEGREGRVRASTRQQISPEDLSAEQIAMSDPSMAKLLQAKRQQQAVIEEMAQSLGSNHMRMVKARTQMESIEDAITERAQLFRTMRGSMTPGEISEDAAGLTLEQIRDQERRVRQLYEQLEAETLNLAQKRRTIDSIRSEMSLIRDRLTDTKNRLDALDVESQVVDGRLEVVSYGDLPSEANPARDRRLPLAVAGAGAGAVGGVALLALFGFTDRRVQHVDDACRSTGQPPLLGVVPQLPDPSDPASLLLTGQSVHHIRTQMQISAKATGTQVFTVAGSSPATGKTSLTLALGLSYATSDHRVLLIDADVTGGALSERSASITRHLLRDALVDHGRLTPEAASTMSDPSFDDIIERGSLSEQQVTDVHELRERMGRGLGEALRGRPLGECTFEVGPPGLSVLTRGGDHPRKSPQMSPERFRRLLDEARAHYEAILIDTGPIPGPVESAVAASEADAVILLMARGDDRARTEHAVDFLRSIGARLMGLVFNRAGEEDVNVFGYSSSESASRPLANRVEALRQSKTPAVPSPAGVGPLVHAMLCTNEATSEAAGNGNGKHTEPRKQP